LLTGDDGADNIAGAGGNNTIVGGTDTVDSDDEGDTITGGPLIDDLSGSGGGDVINGGDGDDNIDAGEGPDIVNAGAASDQDVLGGPGNDTLNGDAGDDVLDGGENPTLPEDSDTLNGGADDDLLLNSDGADTFNGGANNGGANDGDEADYSVTTGSSPIFADIDGLAADDGRAGEGDSIATDVENLTGDGGNDTLAGSAQANDIDGGGGDDDLRGGVSAGADGADVFIGGANGAAGDTVSYAFRTDAIVADIDASADDGGGGCPAGGGCEDDTVGTTVENLDGGSAGDTLTGSAGANRLRGGLGTGADTLNGDLGNDALFGGTGGNTGADGADNLNGGGDIDEASYAGRTDAIVADIDAATDDDGGGGCPAGPGCEDDDLGTDVENVTGGSAGDTLSGDADANLLSGGAGSGNDTLAGGTTASGPDGADAFAGGSGADDTVTYSIRTDEIVAEIGGPIDPIENDDIQSDIENLIGGQVDDRLVGDGDANRLEGGPGDDQLFGSRATGPDGADELVGGTSGLAGGFNGAAGDLANYVARTDSLSVTIGGGPASGASCPGGGCEADDVGGDVEIVASGSGNDTIRGNSGPNRLLGNDGNDTLQGGTGTGPDGADELIGGANTAAGDTISYVNRTDPISAVLNTPIPGVTDGDAITSAENLVGGSGNDVLLGFTNDNSIAGGSGDDVLKGSLNALGDDGADSFSGGTNGAAGDTVQYLGRTDAISADIGGGADDSDGDDLQTDVENISGGSGPDNLTGSAGPNTLTGGNGADTLSSLGGVDRIEAVDGIADTIDCGDGADSAAVDQGLDLLTGCEVLGDPPVPPQPPAGGGQPGGGAAGGPGQTQGGAQARPRKRCKKGQKLKKGKCVKKGKK
jgi:Ca2+-binding RTX toxin-like protein